MTSPLYKKIKTQIIKDIQNGIFKPDELLPSENELAQSYGVSRITSKRALNDLENEGIIYRKRGVGSFVRKSHKQDILFISPFSDTQSFGNYTQGILEVLQDTPYRLQIQKNDHIKVDSLSNYAGVLFYPFHSQDILDFVFPLYQLNIPTVILDKEVAGVPFSSVTSNNFQGGFEAASHLINLGLKTIAFISTDTVDSVSSVRERYFGYLKALNEHGVACPTKPLLCDGEMDFTDVIKSLKKNKVEGIICENDIIAIRIMKELRGQKFSIPKDIKVVGFDNTQAACFVEPPLTTIQQNFSEIGKLATQQLIKIIESNDNSAEKIVVDVELIIRESTSKKETL